MEIWYEVINPICVTTVDGGPVADDYSNIAFTVPDGHRMVAHAVRAGGVVPECLPGDAARVLPSNDLWALADVEDRGGQDCTARHG